jgi:hypothetical protein
LHLKKTAHEILEAQKNEEIAALATSNWITLINRIESYNEL